MVAICDFERRLGYRAVRSRPQDRKSKRRSQRREITKNARLQNRLKNHPGVPICDRRICVLPSIALRAAL
jgi:hypothetical protein